MPSKKHKDYIDVTIENSKAKKYPKGITLEEISREYQEASCTPIIAAVVGNELQELSHILDEDCEIKWIDACSSIGSRIYKRSLTFCSGKSLYGIVFWLPGKCGTFHQ